MTKDLHNKTTRKNSHRSKYKWVVASVSTLALLGTTGISASAEEVPNEAEESSTVHINEETDTKAQDWEANTVEEVGAEIESQEREEAPFYQIQWGDTLSVLGQTVGTSVNQLAEINNIENPHLIYADSFLDGVL